MLDNVLDLMAEKKDLMVLERPGICYSSYKKGNLSLRTTADRFGVPKSVLNKYLSEIGTKPGPY